MPPKKQLKDFKNQESVAKFYLGRILLNVVASRNAKIPVEILDISVEYKNEDLQIVCHMTREHASLIEEELQEEIEKYALFNF